MGLVCWEIGQVGAVDVYCDLHTQCHILVQSDNGHHPIYYPDKLESCTLCQNSKEWMGQSVVVDTAS